MYNVLIKIFFWKSSLQNCFDKKKSKMCCEFVTTLNFVENNNVFENTLIYLL